MIFRIGRLKLKLSFSFVALTALMVILCEEKIVIYSLLSSFIHETGHLFFMWVTGDLPKIIELSFFGMRIEKAEQVCISYKKDFFVAIGGIAFNLLTVLICIALNNFLRSAYLSEFAAVNLIVASINSFPVSALDGGRALKSVFLLSNDKDVSDGYSVFFSDIFLIIFTAATVIYIIFYGINISLVAIILYLIFITIIKKWS